MTPREQQILDIVREDPMVPQQVLADRLGITRAAVAGHLAALMRKGLILGKGYVMARGAFVVVVGGMNMDVCATARETLRQGDSTPGQMVTSAGGVGRNIAENLARLGADARLISLVGDDLYGRHLLEVTRQCGVDVKAVGVVPGCATATYLSVHDAGGSLAHAVNDMTVLDRLSPAQMTPHLSALRHAAVVVADANLPADALHWLMSQCSPAPLMVDAVSAAKCARIGSGLHHLAGLKANRLEAEVLCGHPVTDLALAREAARQLRQRGVQNVVISLGREGAVWLDAQGVGGHCPAISTRVVNTTGAGDALMAGLVFGRLQGWDLRRSVEWGMACAALTLQAPGANHAALSCESVRTLLTAAPATPVVLQGAPG